MIASFSGPHRFLSNFFSTSVEFEGQIYGSVECAYQAAKTLDPLRREPFWQHYGAAAAKRNGKRLPLRPDWETVKLDIMRELLRYKFRVGGPLHLALAQTAPEELVEGNYWGDTFWGQCPVGTGENWLGRLLMELRDGPPSS